MCAAGKEFWAMMYGIGTDEKFTSWHRTFGTKPREVYDTRISKKIKIIQP
jgi:hypothetical protein